jgi:hypothetical protein
MLGVGRVYEGPAMATNSEELMSLPWMVLTGIALICLGCFFWFKIRPNYHRRDEGWS